MQVEPHFSRKMQKNAKVQIRAVGGGKSGFWISTLSTDRHFHGLFGALDGLALSVRGGETVAERCRTIRRIRAKVLPMSPAAPEAVDFTEPRPCEGGSGIYL